MCRYISHVVEDERDVQKHNYARLCGVQISTTVDEERAQKAAV